MRTRIVKKTNKELLRRRGKGFFGRALPVMFGNDFVVLQNIKGSARTEAIIRYCDLTLTDAEILKLQHIFLQKYGVELEIIKSYSDFCGSTQDGKFFARHLQPVNNHIELEIS